MIECIVYKHKGNNLKIDEIFTDMSMSRINDWFNPQ